MTNYPVSLILPRMFEAAGIQYAVNSMEPFCLCFVIVSLLAVVSRSAKRRARICFRVYGHRKTSRAESYSILSDQLLALDVVDGRVSYNQHRAQTFILLYLDQYCLTRGQYFSHKSACIVSGSEILKRILAASMRQEEA